MPLFLSVYAVYRDQYVVNIKDYESSLSASLKEKLGVLSGLAVTCNVEDLIKKGLAGSDKLDKSKLVGNDFMKICTSEAATELHAGLRVFRSTRNDAKV